VSASPAAQELEMSPMNLPAWLRAVLVAGVVALAAGASLYGYRWYARPVTLTIAVGSLDGEASKVVSAIAGQLASRAAPVRLSVVEAGSALGAANGLRSATDPAVVAATGRDRPVEAQAVAAPSALPASTTESRTGAALEAS